MRVGIGYDSHRFASGRPLVLGGITIPFDKGLDGWSDADAVAHALTDAILGGAGLGDIGRMFPPHDPRFRGANSIELLNKAAVKAIEAGHPPQQADITVILERPKLAPHIQEMEQRLAEAIIVGALGVSVKAKTNEGMGWIGRGEGVAAIAVCVLG